MVTFASWMVYLNDPAIHSSPNPKPHPNMRLLSLTLLSLAFPASLVVAQNVGINADGAAPAVPAMLDIDVTALPVNAKKGLLVPRVALTAANNNAPIGATIVNSLLVYNTATAGGIGNEVTPGYYYWDTPSARWRRLLNDADVAGTAWELLGNAGTVATTNFLGTTDAVALRFRTQNFDRFEITQGTVGPAGTGGRLRAFHNGLAGTPIYSFNASPNAGFFSPGVNILAFSTSSVERARIYANGQVTFNSLAPMFVADLVGAQGNGAFPWAINGYGFTNGSGVYGESGAAASHGVLGQGLNAAGWGVWGANAVVATGVGVLGTGNGLPGLGMPAGAGGVFRGNPVGALGQANAATGTGTWGLGNASLDITPLAAGSGVAGRGNTTGVAGWGALAGNGVGVVGLGNAILAPALLATGGGGMFYGNAVGAYGRAATGTNPTGVVGLGNNIAAPTVWTGGSGGAFTGTLLGAYGRATTPASGTGVIGAGNNILPAATFTIAQGSGGAFTGTVVGALGVASAPLGTGTDGRALGADGVGAFGQALPVNGWGTWGQGEWIGALGEGLAAADGVGTYGIGGRFGAIGDGLAIANGIGVVGNGNGLGAPALPVAGGGGLFTGTGFGAWGRATIAASGVGVSGLGNGLTNGLAPAEGAGVAGTATRYGVVGHATNTNTGPAGTVQRTGGYFSSGPAPPSVPDVYAFVAAVDNVPRKIEGIGTVNTIIEDTQGKRVLMSAPEAPENLFQDYGTGQLVNGRATIVLDPILAKNILVNDQHPLRVFVQLRGDCNGVYVANETATGFEVVELMGGTSNAKFYWTVTANRANVISPSGAPWNYAEERFSPAMGPAAVNPQEMMDGGARGAASSRAYGQLTTGSTEPSTIAVEDILEPPTPVLIDPTEVKPNRPPGDRSNAPTLEMEDEQADPRDR